MAKYWKIIQPSGHTARREAKKELFLAKSFAKKKKKKKETFWHELTNRAPLMEIYFEVQQGQENSSWQRRKATAEAGAFRQGRFKGWPTKGFGILSIFNS